MTTPKSFFPLFIDMSGKKVLIIGGGNVAERRVKVLVSFNADITVISPDITEYIERVSSSNLIHLLRRQASIVSESRYHAARIFRLVG